MKHFTIIFFITFFSQNIIAQSWQWGQRGGGFSNSSSTDDEYMIDMDTDPNGNVYLLAYVYADGFPTIGSQLVKKYGNRDLLVASFACNGNLRWYKTIGGTNDDQGVSLRTDSVGHVFVMGSHCTYNVHFDSDTILPNSNRKSMFLVQYDTSGNFKWLRQPAPDTVSITQAPKYFGYDFFADKNGETYMLCFLNGGLLSGGANIVVTPGVYLLRYSVNGTLMSATPMQMNVQENATTTVQYAFFYNIKLVKRNNKFIIAGSVNFNGMFTVFNFSMGGQLIKHGMFLGCFDANGQFLWKKEGSVAGGGFTFRPVIDKQNNFILSTNSGTNKDTLNGTPLINPLGPHSFPLAVKLDSMGNTIWIKSSATNSATLSSAIALNESTNKVYLYGNYPGVLIWDSLQFKNLPNQGYDPFLVTLNAQTGAVLQLDSLESDFGNDEYCGPMVSDKKGNLYMGGRFSGNLYVNGTTLTNSGGRNDFFIAKYGAANCNTAFPVKLLSFTGKQKENTIQLNWRVENEENFDSYVVQRSYNGSLYNSVGVIKANQSKAYTFSDSTQNLQQSTVYYRLKLLDKDGNYSYSSVVIIKIGNKTGFTIYPNPASNGSIHIYFNSNNNHRQTVAITDLLGRPVYAITKPGNATYFTIPLKTKPGIYLVSVTDMATQQKVMAKVVMQ